MKYINIYNGTKLNTLMGHVASCDNCNILIPRSGVEDCFTYHKQKTENTPGVEMKVTIPRYCCLFSKTNFRKQQQSFVILSYNTTK